ncbi:MAG: hypothetical protein NC191_04080 [Muribaculaceae bacterium]|nr:hypothetical protein [Muribaculaceae bacterium]
MKRIILTIFILICSISSVSARTWVQVDDYHYIDKDSIKTYVNDQRTYDFDKRIFWIKSIGNEIYQQVETHSDEEVSYGLLQCIIDYQKQTIAAKAGAIYDKNGQVISSYTYEDYELKWDSIIPDSYAEYWAELVKKPRVLQKMYNFQQNK